MVTRRREEREHQRPTCQEVGRTHLVPGLGTQQEFRHLVAHADGSLCQPGLLQPLSRAMHDRKALDRDLLGGACPYRRELLLE